MIGNKPKILIFSDFYLPGFKSGGAVRTLANMVERMRDEFEFSVVARNHDGWGDYEPYENVKTNEWNLIEEIPVFYFGTNGITRHQLRKIWSEVEPNAVFLVSFFSSLTTKMLLMWRFRQLPAAAQTVPFILAPQGELSAGALNLKANKKRVFLSVTKKLGIYRRLIWKASSETEKADFARIFPNSRQIAVVPDLTPRVILPSFDFAAKPKKKAGELRLIYLSRVNRKKNLAHTLRILQNRSETIVFDVYGAHDDESYWRECLALIEKLPANVKIAVHGSIDYRDVAKTMSQSHFFILPTLSENFGHVVLEAMAAGCPVIISDTTPWRDLNQKNIGWDLDLKNLTAWRSALAEAIAMTPEDFAVRSRSARAFALEWLASPEIETVNRELFRNALKMSESSAQSGK